MESAFSDNSASDYLPLIPGPSSPFSSNSSASSRQGVFPLQLKLQKQNQFQPSIHYSPAPWDTSGRQQDMFQPFSQPRGMTDAVPWSCGSNFFQLETPTAAQVLFGSTDETEAGDRSEQTTTFCLNQPEDDESILDFMLNQSDTRQQFEEDVFSGFSHEEYEASRFGSAKSKIYLTDEKSIRSSTPHSCKCKKIPPETRDAGTQTASNQRAETCDASTQCVFVAKSKAAPGSRRPPVDVSEQRLATERQTGTAAEPDALTASSENSRSEGKQMPRSSKKSKPGYRSVIMNKFPVSNCGKMILQRPTNPFLDAVSNGRGKNGEDENPTKAPSAEGKDEVASGVTGLSEEAETLQEIADILLLLKKRKKEG
nr:PREDICTED: uncharacterized protein LOC103369284 [Stegastes partitus]